MNYSKYSLDAAYTTSRFRKRAADDLQVVCRSKCKCAIIRLPETFVLWTCFFRGDYLVHCKVPICTFAEGASAARNGHLLL